MIFKEVQRQLAEKTAPLDVMIALGTHPAMSEEATCERINMGYRDPASINPADYADREEEGILLVPKAGEMLFQLENPAPWASGS
jgi:hypothetical protein